MAFGFDQKSGELSVDGRRVTLQEQPARVLAYLISRAGQVVSRQELIGHVWSDGRTVQFDQGLNYCIRQVRSALGESAVSPKYIASVGRSGYRWIGPAQSLQRWQRFMTRPVPAWAAASISIACMGATMWLAPAPKMRVTAERGADLRAAVQSVHVLSHVIIDPVLPDSVVRFFNRD